MEHQKVLIVEDDLGIQESLCQILELYDYSIDRASSGEQGLIKAISFEPDIIISDITMPGMDGYEFLSKIRQLPKFKWTPVIFLTARIADEDVQKGLKLGANDYIKKPFKTKDLLHAIENQLSISKQQEFSTEQVSLNLTDKQDSIKNLIVLNSQELRGPLSTAISLSNLLETSRNDIFLHELKSALKKCDGILHTMNELIGMTLHESANLQEEPFSMALPERILFVDDDPVQRLIVQKIFKDKFFKTHVFEADSVQSAMETLDNQNIDLIITDLQMPETSGFEFLQFLEDHSISIPVIVLSSTLHIDEVTKSMKYDNVKLFLTKPFDISKLSSIINF